MRVVIVDHLGSPYDGHTLKHSGLGGSESAVICIARELAGLGVEVSVVNDCTDQSGLPIDGVSYLHRDTAHYMDWDVDVLIASRSVVPIIGEQYKGIRAKKKILWLHDTFVEGDDLLETLVVQDKIDEIWTLSDWHTTYISTANHGHRRMPEVLKRKIWQTRNGVNLYNEYVDIQKKDRNLFIWNASVTKGLPLLLQEVWPRVRKHIPDARLRVIGGYYKLRSKDEQQNLFEDLRSRHEGHDGVEFTGVIRQDVVAEHLTEAGFMIYPQTLPETYGISTVESLAYGTPVISGRYGAMEETAIEDGCYLMDYPIESPLYNFDKNRHIDYFVSMVVEAYNNGYLWQQKAQRAMVVRDVCTWDKVAIQWFYHLNHILGQYTERYLYGRTVKIYNRYKEIFKTRWNDPSMNSVESSTRQLEVIVPFRNARDYILRCIDSIAAQDYDSYSVTLIDDASDDGTYELVCDYLSERDLHDTFYIQKNSKSIGALANQMSCINEINDDNPEAIVVLIDGDDALTNDPNIFKKIAIDHRYFGGYDFTYGSCWSVVDNIPLIAQEYPPDVIKDKSFKDHKFPWTIPYTHLRTFKASLVSKFDDSLLRDSDGNYYRSAGDSALFYALLRASSPDRILAVKDIRYLYNDASPLNDYKVNDQEQRMNAVDIWKKVPEGTKKKKILIAIPTAQNICVDTFKSIYDLEIPDGYETEFQYFYGYRVDQVRNLISDWVIRGYDYLFAVDYDISFAPDTLKRLLKHDKDMVSGLYIQRKPGHHILEIYRTGSAGNQYNVPMQALSKFKLEPIDACGFGCVLIKKKVLEEVGYPQFVYTPSLSMEGTISEDVDFCNKARAKGFEIFADTSVTCRHHGATVFEV